MSCVGDYKDRMSAKCSYRHFSLEVGASCTIFRGSNRMDFISLTDFLDFVLPHVSGPLASTIKLARSKAATHPSVSEGEITQAVAATEEETIDTVESPQVQGRRP